MNGSKEVLTGCYLSISHCQFLIQCSSLQIYFDIKRIIILILLKSLLIVTEEQAIKSHICQIGFLSHYFHRTDIKRMPIVHNIRSNWTQLNLRSNSYKIYFEEYNFYLQHSQTRLQGLMKPIRNIKGKYLRGNLRISE